MNNHKKRLWELLWKYKCQAITNSERHEKSAIFFKKILNITEFIIAVFSGITVVLSGYDASSSPSTIELTILLLACVSFIAQMCITITKIKSRIISHSTADSNFKFLYREIEKLMHLYKSTEEFQIITVLVGDMVSIFENSEIYIPKFINEKFPAVECLAPDAPNSSSFSSHSQSHSHSQSQSQSQSQSHSHSQSQSQSQSQLQIPSEIKMISLMAHIDGQILKDSILVQQYKIENFGFFQTDNDGNMIHVGDNFAYLAGLNKKNITFPSGAGWIINIHREDCNYIYYNWRAAVKNLDIFIDKFRFVHPNGNIIYIFMEAKPKFSRFNIFIGFSGMITQVSEDVWETDIEEEKINILV